MQAYVNKHFMKLHFYSHYLSYSTMRYNSTLMFYSLHVYYKWHAVWWFENILLLFSQGDVQCILRNYIWKHLSVEKFYFYFFFAIYLSRSCWYFLGFRGHYVADPICHSWTVIFLVKEIERQNLSRTQQKGHVSTEISAIPHLDADRTAWLMSLNI